jgi:hypothetical protein
MPGAGGWNVSWGGTGTNGAVVAADHPGYQVPDRARNALKLLGSLRKPAPLTASSRHALWTCAAANTYEDHPDYIDIPINWDALKGDEGDTWTVEAIVSCKCENASTTVTPRIVTAGTTTANVTGAAHATTSWTAQTLPMVSGSGTVTYRLQIKQSDLLYDVRVVAELRLYI